MRESAVDAAVAREAKVRNIWAIKMTGISVAGFPDWMLLTWLGKVAFLECKRPGGRPRPLQRVVHKKLRDRGHRVATVDTPEGVADFFVEWLG
jgi:hypothetical protein